MRRSQHLCACLVAAATIGGALPSAQAAPPLQLVAGGDAYAVPVTSQQTLRFNAMVRQQYDFSCGSAAVATLLTYHYGRPTTEQEAFEEMYRTGDASKIRSEGFSLLDMKRFLAAHGFEADGFELPLEKLAEARLPAIVLINESGYNHFVVVKGLRDGRVLIGDPTKGSRVMLRSQFDSVWPNRLLFVVHNQQDLATFNSQADWRATPLAPMASGISREPIATLPRMGPNEL